MGLGKQLESYAEHKDQVYCLPCYEQNVAHSCQVCSNAITAGQEQLSSGEYHWHLQCFKCMFCDRKLDADQFLMAEAKIICPTCHAEKFAKCCAACGETISTESLGSGDKHWHPACFVCVECKESLADKSFVSPPQGITCVPCYKKASKRVCKACDTEVESGGLVYKDNCYHESCFVCSVCGVALQTSPFVHKEGAFFCEPCYEQKYARQCRGCKTAITNRGGKGSYVSIKDTCWHDGCFKCLHCEKALNDAKFSFTGGNLTCRPLCAGATAK